MNSSKIPENDAHSNYLSEEIDDQLINLIEANQSASRYFAAFAKDKMSVESFKSRLEDAAYALLKYNAILQSSPFHVEARISRGILFLTLHNHALAVTVRGKINADIAMHGHDKLLHPQFDFISATYNEKAANYNEAAKNDFLTVSSITSAGNQTPKVCYHKAKACYYLSMILSGKEKEEYLTKLLQMVTASLLKSLNYLGRHLERMNALYYRGWAFKELGKTRTENYAQSAIDFYYILKLIAPDDKFLLSDENKIIDVNTLLQESVVKITSIEHLEKAISTLPQTLQDSFLEDISLGESQIFLEKIMYLEKNRNLKYPDNFSLRIIEFKIKKHEIFLSHAHACLESGQYDKALDYLAEAEKNIELLFSSIQKEESKTLNVRLTVHSANIYQLKAKLFLAIKSQLQGKAPVGKEIPCDKENQMILNNYQAAIDAYASLHQANPHDADILQRYILFRLELAMLFPESRISSREIQSITTIIKSSNYESKKQKEIIYSVIKNLPLEKQIKLIEICLKDDKEKTSLSRPYLLLRDFFWEKSMLESIFSSDTSLLLQEMKNYLARLKSSQIKSWGKESNILIKQARDYAIASSKDTNKKIYYLGLAIQSLLKAEGKIKEKNDFALHPKLISKLTTIYTKLAKFFLKKELAERKQYEVTSEEAKAIEPSHKAMEYYYKAIENYQAFFEKNPKDDKYSNKFIDLIFHFLPHQASLKIIVRDIMQAINILDQLDYGINQQINHVFNVIKKLSEKNQKYLMKICLHESKYETSKNPLREFFAKARREDVRETRISSQSESALSDMRAYYLEPIMRNLTFCITEAEKHAESALSDMRAYYLEPIMRNLTFCITEAEKHVKLNENMKAIERLNNIDEEFFNEYLNIGFDEKFFKLLSHYYYLKAHTYLAIHNDEAKAVTTSISLAKENDKIIIHSYQQAIKYNPLLIAYYTDNIEFLQKIIKIYLTLAVQFDADKKTTDAKKAIEKIMEIAAKSTLVIKEKKEFIFDAIKLLSDEDQSKIIEACLDRDNKLPSSYQVFKDCLWISRMTTCNKTSGTLLEMKVHLLNNYIVKLSTTEASDLLHILATLIKNSKKWEVQTLGYFIQLHSLHTEISKILENDALDATQRLLPIYRLTYIEKINNETATSGNSSEFISDFCENLLSLDIDQIQQFALKQNNKRDFQVEKKNDDSDSYYEL